MAGAPDGTRPRHLDTPRAVATQLRRRLPGIVIVDPSAGVLEGAPIYTARESGPVR